MEFLVYVVLAIIGFFASRFVSQSITKRLFTILAIPKTVHASGAIYVVTARRDQKFYILIRSITNNGMWVTLGTILFCCSILSEFPMVLLIAPPAFNLLVSGGTIFAALVDRDFFARLIEYP